MNKIKKGDIVGRISYGKDIAFSVERILKTKKGESIAILKGITIRVEADSSLDDLELMEAKQVEEHVRAFEETLIKKAQKYALKQNEETNKNQKQQFFREKVIVYTGKILHVDGDKKYSEKSNRYYKKVGLNAIVRNVPERKQPFIIGNLIRRYKPDIVIITRS